MKVSIVIPTWNVSDYTVRCFSSLRGNLNSETKLIWVDNESDDKELYKVYNKVDWSHTYLIRNKKNLGFLVASNQGIRLGLEMGADAILLLNNDTEMYAGCVNRLIGHLAHGDIVCPVSNNSSETTPARIRAHIPDFPLQNTPNGSEYDNMLRSRYAGQTIPRIWVAFFCALIKKEVFKRIGLLDEDFTFGYREDRDFCYSARKAGFKSVGALDTFVFHALSKTFAQADPYFKSQEYWDGNWEILHRKHPEYAGPKQGSVKASSATCRHRP